MAYAFFDSFGDIKFTYDGPNLSGQSQNNINLDFILVDEVIDANAYWIPDVNNALPELLPVKPSKYHRFDYVLRAWVLPSSALDTAKNKAIKAIEQYVDDLHNSTITYDSKLLDADPVARENINGKINQLKAEVDLSLSSSNLFWKDADNVVHSWSSAAVYLEWLQGLVIAIASRRTNLYAQVWQAKADVAALTDIADVLAFDVAAAFA
jgi:hypothetical protein